MAVRSILTPLLLLAATHIQAQTLPGLDLVRDAGGQALTNLLSNGNFFQDTLNTAWRSYKTKADKAVENAIGDNNKNLPRGVTIYYQHSSLTTNGTVQTSYDTGARTISLKYTLRNNYIECHSTLPGPTGQWADPKISLNYDVDLTVVIPVPSLTAPLKVQKATISFYNAHNLDSHNFTADVAKAAAALVKSFGGPDLVAMAQSKITGQMDFSNSIDQALGPVNQSLQALAQQGFSNLSAAPNLQTRRLVLRAAVPMVTVGIRIDTPADVLFGSDASGDLTKTIQAIRSTLLYKNSPGLPTNQIYTTSIPANSADLSLAILLVQRHTYTVPNKPAQPIKPIRGNPGDSSEVPKPVKGQGPSATALPPPYNEVDRVIHLYYDRRSRRLVGTVSNGAEHDSSISSSTAGIRIPASGDLPGATISVLEGH